MTQQTINLYDGLEALYYFDPTYYDGTAGEIKDKSGHGRHAQASGGPTIGVNGPDSFEATSFDGSDDYFVAPSNLHNNGPYAIFIVFRPDTEGTGSTQVLMGTRGTSGFSTGVDNLGDVLFQHDDGTTHKLDLGNTQVDEWMSLLVGYNGNSAVGYVDGKLRAKQENVGDLTESGHNLSIGAKASSKGSNISADVSTFAKYSRFPTDAEIEALNRLTAPRRAQL